MKKVFTVLLAALAMFAVSAQSADIAANEKVEAQTGNITSVSKKGVKIWVVGDSTLSPFDDPYYYPRYGYGTQLQKYIDAKKAEVVNLAISGRSSKSFLSEAYYKLLCENIKKGDYLIIGFGHNDEKAEEARYTNPNGSKEEAGSFKNCLYVNYVKMALDKKATPVLCTPIVRRAPGKAYEGNYVHVTNDQPGFPGGDYPKAIRELAAECKVPLIDNTAKTKALYEEIGDDESVKLHAWLKNKVQTVDNTHLNIYGASKIAYMVVTDLAAQDKKFAKLVLPGITEPTEEALVPNPNYVIPVYAPFVAKEDKSLCHVTTEPWYGTVFGDCGGGEKISSTDFYEINDSTGVVEMRAGDKKSTVSAGKIANAQDGIAFYFQQIKSNQAFTLTAHAKVMSINNKNNQVAFGVMARDDVLIDKYDNSVNSNYAAAGVLSLANDNFNTSFSRKDGTLTKTPVTSEPKPANGTEVDLKISGDGNGNYTVQYGADPVVTYSVDLKEKDADYIYVGPFVVRSCWVEFSNVKLTLN